MGRNMARAGQAGGLLKGPLHDHRCHWVSEGVRQKKVAWGRRRGIGGGLQRPAFLDRKDIRDTTDPIRPDTGCSLPAVSLCSEPG